MPCSLAHCTSHLCSCSLNQPWPLSDNWPPVTFAEMAHCCLSSRLEAKSSGVVLSPEHHSRLRLMLGREGGVEVEEKMSSLAKKK